MKRTYIKPAEKVKNIHINNMICNSVVGVGSGSAEDADGSGWTFNSRSGDLDLFGDDSSSLLNELGSSDTNL